MNQASVLIVSDDPEFARAVTGRWQAERTVPAFTLMGSDVSLGLDPDAFNLAISGSIRPSALSVVLEAMEAAGKRVVFVSEDLRLMQTVRDRWPGIAVVRREENWLDALILVAEQCVTGTASPLGPLHTGNAAHSEQHSNFSAGQLRIAAARTGITFRGGTLADRDHSKYVLAHA